MDILTVLKGIAYIVVTLCLVDVTAYIVKFITVKVDDLQKSIENEAINARIDDIQYAVEKAVSYVSQTYVNDLKKYGKFTGDSQVVAKEMAIDAVKSLVSESALKIVKDFDSYVSILIESVVEENKKYY